MSAQTRPILLLCLLFVSSLTFANNSILIVTSSNSKYQQELTKTIQSELAGTPLKPQVTDASLLDEDNITNKDLVIAIGKDSVSIISKNAFKTTILNAITNASKHKTIARQSVGETKVYMTQPVCRQLRLIKALNRDWKNIGVLLSKENSEMKNKLLSCGKKYDITAMIVTVDDDTDLVTALNKALTNSDVLLSLPDLAIYNPRTIKNILLTSYRHRVPIIGFSESFANAGAIAAVHTSAEQLGKQIVDIVRQYYKNNKSLSRLEYYPSNFSVITNRQVAHSLEIEIQSNEIIESIMRKMESKRE